MKTNLIDRAGKDIYVGDKVLKAWGWFTWNGKQRTQLRISTINMRQEGNKITFLLGSCWNSWNGGEVLKLDEDDLDCYGMEDDVDFFIDDIGKSVKVTDQHIFNLSEDMWQAELERRNKILFDFMLKWEGNPEVCDATMFSRNWNADDPNIPTVKNK